MFPGNYAELVTYNTQSKFNPNEYTSILGGKSIKSATGASSAVVNNSVLNKGICVPIYIDDRDEKTPLDIQHLNQWLYFRCLDAYNYKDYYKIATTQDKDTYTENGKLVGFHENYVISEDNAKIIYPEFFNVEWLGGMCAFPHITSLKDICITETDNINYKIIYPGESLEVPISITYSLSSSLPEITKTMAFDLRNSLYNDPLNFKFNLKAKYSNSLANNIRKIKKVRYNPVVIN